MNSPKRLSIAVCVVSLFLTPLFAIASVLSVHVLVNTGAYDSVLQAVPMNLSLLGGTKSSPVHSWSLFIACPGSVTVFASSTAICGTYEASSTSDYGNLISLPLLVKNFSTLTQKIPVVVKALDANKEVIGSSDIVLVSPPTFNVNTISTGGNLKQAVSTGSDSMSVKNSLAKTISQSLPPVYVDDSFLCTTFKRNLTVGSPMTSKESAVLTKILSDEGLLDASTTATVFNSDYKAALKQFQAKYSVPSTGFFGHLTRNKIRLLHGCAPEPAPVIIPVSTYMPTYTPTSAPVDLSATCPMGYVCIPLASTTNPLNAVTPIYQ